METKTTPTAIFIHKRSVERPRSMLTLHAGGARLKDSNTASSVLVESLGILYLDRKLCTTNCLTLLQAYNNTTPTSCRLSTGED